MLSRWRLKRKARSNDGPTVLDAAAELDTSEFEIFRLAHRAWFGHDAEEKSLERMFAVYMFHDRVPLWVRHLCRDIVEAAPAPDADAVALPALDPEQRRHVLTLAVAVTAAVFIMTIGAGSIPPGCPGAYVEPTQNVSDEAPRPIC